MKPSSHIVCRDRSKQHYYSGSKMRNQKKKNNNEMKCDLANSFSMLEPLFGSKYDLCKKNASAKLRRIQLSEKKLTDDDTATTFVCPSAWSY